MNSWHKEKQPILAEKPFPLKYTLIIAAITTLLIGLLYIFRGFFVELVVHYTNLFSDREATQAFIDSFGMGAPAVFMLVQILQVMFAPIPGEATGFIGGYLFGAGKGFLYSGHATQ